MKIRGNMSIPDELFSEIKHATSYDGADATMLDNLKSSIARGVGAVRAWSSDLELDFDDDGEAIARQLLIDYVRYDLEGMTADFVQRYGTEITALRARKEAQTLDECQETENIS